MPRFALGPHHIAIEVEMPVKIHEDGDREHVGGWDVVIGGGREATRQRYRTRDEAYRAAHAAIAEHQNAGFALVVDELAVGPPIAARFASYPELEQRIDDAPDDDATWQVLGDAWLEAGDPRGECVAMDRALRDVTDPGRFLQNKRAAEAARLVRNAELWGGLGRDGYRVRAGFRRLLVDKVELRDERRAPGRSTDTVLAAVLASPFARFLRELIAVDVDLADAPGHRHLRSLTLGWVLRDDDRGGRARCCELARFDRAFPRLETLVAQAPRIDLSGAAFAHLRRLELSAPLSIDELEQVFAWIWAHPRLEQVTGYTSHGDGAAPQHAARIVDARLANRAAWPATLQQLAWDGRTARR